MAKRTDRNEILLLFAVLAVIFILLKLLAPILIYLLPIFIVVALLYAFGIIPSIGPRIRSNDLKESNGFHYLKDFSKPALQKSSLEEPSGAFTDIQEFPSELKAVPEAEPFTATPAAETYTLPCSMPRLKAGNTPHIQNQSDTVYFVSRHEKLENPYFREKD